MVRDRLPEDLQPYEADLYRMLREALALYHRDFAHVRGRVSTIRGERNNVHDCMRAVAKTMFPYIDEGNKFEIVLAGRYQTRCKKMSVKLETSNYPTQAVFHFEQQIALTLFPELAPISLYVGYVPDPIDIRNSTFWVVQPGPDGWVYQLREAAQPTMPVPQATDPNSIAPKTRVQPKRKKKTAADEE